MTPVVLEATVDKLLESKGGFILTLKLSRDMKPELKSLIKLGSIPLNIVVVTAEEFNCLEGDLH